MTYRVEVDDRAVRALLRLPLDDVRRIREAIVALAQDPRPPGSRKLTGREGHRVRVGNYRVLYDVDDDLRRVRIYRIGHRRDVYR